MRSLMSSFYFIAIIIFVSTSFISAQAVDEMLLSRVHINPTFEHIAVHVDIIGDDNLNSEMLIEFRPQGSAAFLPGSLVMRAYPDMVVGDSLLNMNFHAGSAMHLMPNTEYDLRLTLQDSDGGSQVIDTSASTNKFPTVGSSNNTLYVVPGTGGGDGSIGTPFQGIQAAVSAAVAGDIIEVSDGLYTPFVLDESGTEDLPIVIKSTNLHGAIIDGNNTSTAVVTIGVFDDSTRYVIIDGFDIKNGKWGIDAQNTQYLAIKNNKISDVDFGIYNRRANGWEHDQYIFNNEIIGRTLWPQTNGEIPAERGVDIRGNRNVVSHNMISDFGDGISTDGPPYKISYALDIHHNDITRVVDDIIEIDGSISNTRVYNNRGYNGRMGVSVAPVFGGPAYIFRNEFYNLKSSAFKMNRQPAGLVIVNNSVVKLNRGLTSDNGWQNTVFKNNAILSSEYVFEEYGLVAGSIDDWNYNGYKSLRSGTSGAPWFKWDNIRYNNIATITSSGVTEANSIGIDFSDFVDVSMPQSYAIEALTSANDFQLPLASTLIDAGVAFDNVLDHELINGSPDIGAYEFGQIPTRYGHDFSEVCDRLDVSSRTWNGSHNEGWYHPANWTPCGVPIHSTDVVIPGGLLRYPFVNANTTISNLYILNNGKLDLIEGTVFKISN